MYISYSYYNMLVSKSWIILAIVGFDIGLLPLLSYAQLTPTKQELRLEKRSLRKAQKQQRAYEKSLEKQPTHSLFTDVGDTQD